MKGLAGIAILLALASPAIAQQATSAEAAAKIEAHLLRVENAQLRAQVAGLEAELASVKLTAERVALEAALRVELKPPADWVFDWTRRAFVEPPKKEPK